MAGRRGLTNRDNIALIRWHQKSHNLKVWVQLERNITTTPEELAARQMHDDVLRSDGRRKFDWLYGDSSFGRGAQASIAFWASIRRGLVIWCGSLKTPRATAMCSPFARPGWIPIIKGRPTMGLHVSGPSALVAAPDVWRPLGRACHLVLGPWHLARRGEESDKNGHMGPGVVSNLLYRIQLCTR